MRPRRIWLLPLIRCASKMAPAQVPMTGSSPRPAASTTGCNNPNRSMSIPIVVLSPPGTTSPSRPRSSSGRRTGRLSTPHGMKNLQVSFKISLKRDHSDRCHAALTSFLILYRLHSLSSIVFGGVCAWVGMPAARKKRPVAAFHRRGQYAKSTSRDVPTVPYPPCRRR